MSGGKVEALKQAVPGLGVKDSIQKASDRLKNTMTALRQATIAAAKSTTTLVNANWHGQLFDVKEQAPFELWHLQMGLKKASGEELKLDAPEVGDVIGVDSFSLLGDDIKPILDENKAELQVVGPSADGTTMQFILKIDTRG